MKRLPYIALAGTALLLAGPSAQAQIAGASSAPVGINAESFEYRQNECRSVWRGRVEATQEQSRLRANELNVFGRKSGDGCAGDFERMEASGEVFYVTPELKVRGDRAVYLASANTITITGKVVVSAESGVTETNRLVLNVETGDARMGDDAPGQRVRAVLYPSQAQNRPAPKP